VSADPLALVVLLVAIVAAGLGALLALRLRSGTPRTPALAAEPGERSDRQALARIGALLTSEADLDRVLSGSLTALAQAVGAERAAIQLIAPGSDRLLQWASHSSGEASEPVVRPLPDELRHGLAGWVIEHRQAALIPDVSRDRRWIPFPDAEQDRRSALAVPLLLASDAVGACVLLARSPRSFSPADSELAAAAASLMAAAVAAANLRRDLHEGRRREAEAIHRQQAESSRAQAVFESIADGVLVTGAGHTIESCNAAAERILLVDREAIVGQPAAQWLGVYGPAGRRWAEALQAWSQDPPPAGSGASLTDRLELEQRRVVEVHVAPVVLGSTFLGTVTVFRDISREVEVDHLKSDFIATVSHELRTPMTSIRGYVQMMLLQAAGPLTDEQRKFMETIRSNADRLGRLVNDLLDLSRLETGADELDLQPVDLLPLLEAEREFLVNRSIQESKALHIEIEAEAPLPLVQADPSRLQQILRGLLDNAFNFTPAGGSVTIRVRRLEGRVGIEIEDTGTGIAPAEQPRVFERFFRGEQALNLGVPGTGLGLSIIARLVERHGGTIGLESAGIPGRGSRFTVTLPAAAPAGG
jgi:signal transduction histidine kinase